jgi:hypothetical protein
MAANRLQNKINTLMKKLLKTAFLTIISFSALGQDYNCSYQEEGELFSAYVASFEEDTIDGTLDVNLRLLVKDTVTKDLSFDVSLSGYLTDSASFFSPYAAASSTGPAGNYLPGDTVFLTINTSYSTINLPVYPMDFKVRVSAYGGLFYVILSQKQENCKLFFTPWNSTEVSSVYEFYGAKRVWLSEDATATRVFVPKSSIPSTDIIDSIADTTDYIVQLRYFDDVPFAVPYNTPDTFNYDTSNFSELKSKADGCGWGRKEFQFRIENLRFGTWHTPPGASPIWVPLRNAKAEFRINRWPDQIINHIAKTNNDGYLIDQHGNTTFSVDFCGIKNRNYDLAITLSMRDPDHKNELRVKYGYRNEDRKANIWKFHMFSTHTIKIHNSYTSESVVSDDWVSLSTQGTETAYHYTIPAHALGLTYSLARLAIDYTNTEIEDLDKDKLPNLTIRVSDDEHGSHYGLDIKLEDGDRNSEGTIFHEIGHHVFHYFYGIFGIDQSKDHSGEFNCHNQNVTLNEGLANGYQAIMDEMTWAVLGNRSNEREIHERPFFRIRNGFETDFTRPSDGVFDRHLTTPYLSQDFVSAAFLDLWDGPNNYLTYQNTVEDPFDEDLNNDNCELSFAFLLDILSLASESF